MISERASIPSSDSGASPLYTTPLNSSGALDSLWNKIYVILKQFAKHFTISLRSETKGSLRLNEYSPWSRARFLRRNPIRWLRPSQPIPMCLMTFSTVPICIDIWFLCSRNKTKNMKLHCLVSFNQQDVNGTDRNVKPAVIICRYVFICEVSSHWKANNDSRHTQKCTNYEHRCRTS